jgi:hypothetical protein
MEKAAQPIIRAVERAADKRGDVGRSEESIPPDCAHNLQIAVVEPKRYRLGGSPEAGPAGKLANRGIIHAQRDSRFPLSFGAQQRVYNKM